MAQFFDFTRLIQKYSVICKLETAASGGYYAGGEWIPDPTAPPPVDVAGALIPMTDRKIYQSGGSYTEQDREFISLVEIELGPACCLVYKGERYQVRESTDYSGYAGFYAYNLKRVGAFDR